MADVHAGDIIVHYSSGAVRALGLATGTAYAAPQPANFDDDRPANWEERGQRLDVSYHELKQTIPLERISAKLQSLSIADGPLNRVDGVKQGYLWRFSVDGLRVLREASDEAWPEWAEEAANYKATDEDEERFFTALTEMCTPAGLAAARRLYAYAKSRDADAWKKPAPKMLWRTARLQLAGKRYSAFALGEGEKNEGVIAINFDAFLYPEVPTTALTELAETLRTIPGATERLKGLEEQKFSQHPQLSLDHIMARPGAVEKVEAAFDTLAQRIVEKQKSSGNLVLIANNTSKTPTRILKIAPGERAELWDLCEAEGRIRIGWEAVGDIRNYRSQDDFITAFRIHYPTSAISTAYALWGLLDLQPGDLIIANKGQSEVVGVGEVIAPGYEWAPDHAWAQHSVRVHWQPDSFGPIERQTSWIKTIMPVTPNVWAQIKAQLGAGESTSPQLVTFDDLMAALRERGLTFASELVANYLLALQTKRFVILTGISGTGKTQLALAVAEAFRSRVRVSRAATHADNVLDIEVKPYMVNHKLMVLPVQFTANLLMPPLDVQTGSGQITVFYPQGTTTLSLRKDPTRNVTDLFFKGEFRAWFTAQLRPSDHFLLEPVEQGDDLPHALRFILPRIETAETLLDNLLVTAVRPDWTDNRGLLGYHNPLTGQYARTPFLDLLLRAGAEEEVAKAEERPARPFFAILDEMNLARVEHYFADFLSALESEQPLHLHGDATLASDEAGEDGGVPQQLAIPANLFFTGTVNVDETTYMFSPKVLDRAFTLEFNRVDLRSLGDPASEADTSLALDGFPGTLTYARRPDARDWDALGTLGDGRWRAPVLAIHDLLIPENRHFGYRVANEIARFVVLAAEQAGDDPATLGAALDLAILEKVLPKFHGTQQELEPILTALAAFALYGTQHGEISATTLLDDWSLRRAGRLVAVGTATGTISALPRTAAKLWGMLRRLRQQGFTSFIE